MLDRLFIGSSGSGATGPLYVEDVFGTAVYTGTGATQTVNNGIPLGTYGTSIGQQAFTTPGTYSFVVPGGVTNISAVCVGGGGGGYTYNTNSRGGGGGALAYVNDIPVTPGETLTVVVGAGGAQNVSGGASRVHRAGTNLVLANGGTSGSTPTGGTVGLGTGGNGGSGHNNSGGGGAGGYAGNGGAGGAPGGGGSGGAGGGGNAKVVNLSPVYDPNNNFNYTYYRYTSVDAGGGGGVGLFGQGASGAGGSGGGSGGASGGAGFAGAYGGGGYGGGYESVEVFVDGVSQGESVTPYPSGPGAGGAVRIIWGLGRRFPLASTAADQTPLSGTIATGEGLVWIKGRSSATDHALYDTARGATLDLVSNSMAAQTTQLASLTAFTGSGFSIGSLAKLNTSAATYISWTFRKAPKFFDVVTYTGNGVNGRAISHSLGATPGCIIVKATNTSGLPWFVYHRSAGVNGSYPNYLYLNSTSAAQPGEVFGWNAVPTATEFFIGQFGDVNNNGTTYVAYLFAHDATADGIIQCGSYLGNGSATGPTVTLGWEPQYLMIKNASGTGNWQIVDNMRGTPVGAADATLQANLSNAESSVDYVSPAATGFQVTSSSTEVNTNASTYIYIAIRRGPMKAPTVGTSVFAPVARSGTGANATVSAEFVTDAVIEGNRASGTAGTKFGAWDRLRGTKYLITNTTAAETSAATTIIQANPWDVMGGYKVGTTSTLTNASSNTFINWMFRRVPGFFDVVCYTGTGVAGAPATFNHNLGVVPELLIYKNRGAAATWIVQSAAMGSPTTNYLNLNSSTGSASQANLWQSLTETTFGFGSSALVSDVALNATGGNYVAYLFASCPGVSKVGSYTGNGSSQTINCGFSNGARFVMIKRTDAAGNWFVWDTARGIVAANDPHLSLNTSAAEVTTNDSMDPGSAGFAVNQVAATNINVSGASYIYLAIA